MNLLQRSALLALFALAIASPSVFARKSNDPRIYLYDAKHYDLSIEFDVLNKAFTGSVIVEGKALKHLSQLVLSASNETLTIDSVVTATGRATFRHEGDHAVIQMPAMVFPNGDFKVTVYYRGVAKFKGQYDAGGVYITLVKGLGRIATTSEPNYARMWWPCKDVPNDKATININATVPSNLIAVSNGILKKSLTNASTTTYQWESKYPTATYLVNISAARYKQFSDTYVGLDGKRMKILYYVFPEDFAKAKFDFANTAAIMKYFATTFCEYPFINEKFGYVEVAGNLTMENQTICTIEDRLITGDRQYELTFVHEIAHHWWGNLVTLENWQHTWLNEGFATYAEALWIEHNKGFQEYQKHMTNLMNIRSGYYSGSVIGRSDTSFWDSFSHRVYNKGAIVLHMLRGVMGDEKFFTVMRNFVNNPKFRYANATTEDFIAESENVYGKSLRWFFDQWVFAYTESLDRPEYEYYWRGGVAGSAHTVNLTIDQTNSQKLLYRMPMSIRVTTQASTYSFEIVDSLATQTFTFQVPERPQYVELDKDNWIFKTVFLKDPR